MLSRVTVSLLQGSQPWGRMEAEAADEDDDVSGELRIIRYLFCFSICFIKINHKLLNKRISHYPKINHLISHLSDVYLLVRLKEDL